MRLLVVGANGLLGSKVVHAGQQRGWNVCGTYHSEQPAFDIPLTQFDLQEYDSFDDVVGEHDPDAVIYCAAMTGVDGCETNPEQAHVLNGDAPGGLAAYCDTRGIRFVHISTDYVFDGRVREPYSESLETNPTQVYGESKLAVSEWSLTKRQTHSWPGSRSSGVYRSDGSLTGFPAWVRGQLRSDAEVPLFTDQWVTTTRAGQAAETLLDLIETEATSTFHLACASCVTPYVFGELIADAGSYCQDLLSGGQMDDVERDATRPVYSCIDVERVESVLGRPQPGLREDLEAVWETLA